MKKWGSRLIATVNLVDGRSRKYTLARASLGRLEALTREIGAPRGQFSRGLPVIFWKS